MTINVARQWHQEHRMGSIEFGKIANMAVFDCDFLHDDLYNDDMTGEFVWTKEDNVIGWAYLKHGQDILADEMIYYSPAVATPEQLVGFPTTFLIVGTLDLFVHEDLAFVEQLKKAGVQAEAFVETGVPHSYNVMLNDSPQTIRFKNLREDAVRKMFGLKTTE